MVQLEARTGSGLVIREESRTKRTAFFRTPGSKRQILLWEIKGYEGAQTSGRLGLRASCPTLLLLGHSILSGTESSHTAATREGTPQ